MFCKATLVLTYLVIVNTVDGRFQRLSSRGYSGLKGIGGRWRLMSPKQIIDYQTPRSGHNLLVYPNVYQAPSSIGKSGLGLGSSVDPVFTRSMIPLALIGHRGLSPHNRLIHNQFRNPYEPDSGETEVTQDQIKSTNQVKSPTDDGKENGEAITTEKTNHILTNDALSPALEVTTYRSHKKNSTKPEKTSTSLEVERFSFIKKASIESMADSRPISRSLNYGKHGGPTTFSDLYFVAIVVGLSGIAIFGVIGAGYCFYRFQQHNKAAADIDYPAYGVVGPVTKEVTNSGNISPVGDRKLAQSAQMYHYHHQKQQMIASEKVTASRHTSASDIDSEEENEEGDYTVYECPGLASTGEMEVKNPLFQDDITPVSSPLVNTTNDKDKK